MINICSHMFLVIAEVPRRLGQEFRRECYPTWHPPDFGQALWCGNNIWCFEQGALLPQTRIRRNVAKFGVWLLQHVQILLLEYLWRIQLEHMEEVKMDHLYESLNPEYKWMLVWKVDGEHPARYSELLLGAHKLERWTEMRDPLLLKTTSMGESNVTHSLMTGNMFPSQKLKGIHNFTAR